MEKIANYNNEVGFINIYDFDKDSCLMKIGHFSKSIGGGKCCNSSISLYIGKEELVKMMEYTLSFIKKIPFKQNAETAEIKCIDFMRILMFNTTRIKYEQYLSFGYTVQEAQNYILLEYPELLSVPREEDQNQLRS